MSVKCRESPQFAPPIRRQPNWVAFAFRLFSFPRWGHPRWQSVDKPFAGLQRDARGRQKSKISSPKIKSESGNADLRRELAQARRELNEARQQQTATADVLKIISRSTFDLQTVFDMLAEAAARLCNANSVVLARPKVTTYDFEATYGDTPEFASFLRAHPAEIGRGTIVGRALLERKIIHVHDVLTDPEYNYTAGQKIAGYRTVLGVPLLREGVPIGAFALRRNKVLPFADKQIELVETFADQAVIAIENVRLFDEVQAKTRDLTEALTYQTGSANILNVIASSPTDVQPVLKAIVESACELCGAYDAVVILKDGEDLQLSAHHGPIPINRQRWVNDRTSLSGRAMADRRPVHVHDVLSDEGLEFAVAREMSRVDGCHTLLSAPLLREGEAIGAITLRRAEVHPFSDKQVALLQTFADQAVIAPRQRPAVRGGAGEDPRSHGLARTADGDLGSVADHQLISWGSRAGVPENARERRARLRSTLWHDGYVEWRKFP